VSDVDHDEREDFLRRWSRLKEAARSAEPAPAPVPAAADSEPPALPPVEKLTLESDYRGFFHPKVEEGLRRAALKKLFSDPHFNVMDGLDVYIDDYSKSDPLPAAMLDQLEHAQKILRWAREGAESTSVRPSEESATLAAASPLPSPAGPGAPEAEESGDAAREGPDDATPPAPAS